MFLGTWRSSGAHNLVGPKAINIWPLCGQDINRLSTRQLATVQGGTYNFIPLRRIGVVG